MSTTKRKVFTFNEYELEWINPLLMEWENENEGKGGGVLITELLKKYREPNAYNKLEDARNKIRTEFNRFKLRLDSVFFPYQVRVREILCKLILKLNNVADRMAEDMEKGFST